MFSPLARADLTVWQEMAALQAAIPSPLILGGGMFGKAWDFARWAIVTGNISHLIWVAGEERKFPLRLCTYECAFRADVYFCVFTGREKPLAGPWEFFYTS